MKAPLRHSLLLSAGLFCILGSASAKVLFKADFETGDLSEWNNTGTRGQNATPRNVQVVTDIVQQGKYAAKVTIHEDDVFNAQQLRAQLGGPRITVEEGSDTFMSFWLYMAEPPKDRDNFFYWEGNPPPRYDNVMTWWVEPKEGGGTLIKYGTGNLGRNGTEWAADFTTGKWHQLAMHIHWSEDKEKGNTRLWLDGALVLDRKLKTKGPESVYFCQPGIHRSPHRPSVDTIYFDNFILADTLEDVLKEVPAKASIGRGEQFLLFDVTFSYTKQDADTWTPSKSHYYVRGDKLNPDRPRDWTSPVDYRNGTVHICTEVIGRRRARLTIPAWRRTFSPARETKTKAGASA